MMDGMNDFWGMGFGYGWIIGLIVFVIVVGLIMNVLKQKKYSNKPKYNSPLEILNTRYARGEISKYEYDEKKRNIS